MKATRKGVLQAQKSMGKGRRDVCPTEHSCTNLRGPQTPVSSEDQQTLRVLASLTLNTWKTASSSSFQSTFPLTLLHPRKNSCCFKSCEARADAREPRADGSKKGRT